MFFALNQTLRWKILLLYYQWTESVQPGVLKRLFSANFQLSYFLWWTFFAALHNSKLKLILMYLIMAPLSPICFSHSDLFCTSPWSFSASYWWFCMFLWLFCVSLSVCAILHCIKVIFLTFWQKTFRSALQLTWWKLCPHCRGMALIPLQAIYCPALLTLLSSKMTDKKETVEKCLPIKFRVIMSCNIPLQFADIISFGAHFADKSIKLC